MTITCLWEVSVDCDGRAVYGVRERPDPEFDVLSYPVWPACEPCAMQTRNDDRLMEVIPIPDWLHEQEAVPPSTR
jgi:hypothetical protein